MLIFPFQDLTDKVYSMIIHKVGIIAIFMLFKIENKGKIDTSGITFVFVHLATVIIVIIHIRCDTEVI